MSYLYRFLKAQEGVYSGALDEIKNGRKKSHWMGCIFPQLRGLGTDEESFLYGVVSIREAQEYLDEPVLRERLIECCEATLAHKNKSADDIFGCTDAEKLWACMTLFAFVSEDDSVFHKVLNQFFDGKQNAKTISLLCDNGGLHIADGEVMGYYGEEESVAVPAGVVSVQEKAFYKNEYIRRLSLPYSLKTIGNHAFAGCIGLQNINFASSVIQIGNNAFSGCEKLADEQGLVIVNGILFDCYTEKEVVFVPKGVTTIGKYAFARAWSTLQTLYLPESVVSIEHVAFWKCRNLKNITLSEKLGKIALNAFADCEKVTVHAPSGSYAEAYAKGKNMHYIEE